MGKNRNLTNPNDDLFSQRVIKDCLSEAKILVDASVDSAIQSAGSQKRFNFASPKPEDKLIKYLEPKLKEYQSALEHQVKAIELIAHEAQGQSESVAEQVKIMQEQLAFAKQEAESAKKEATFSKILAVLAIVISIAIPILTDVVAPLLIF